MVLNDTIGVVTGREDRKRSRQPPSLGNRMRHHTVFCILTVLLLSSAVPFATPAEPITDNTEDGTSSIERIVITPDPDSIGSAHPSASWDGEERIRETVADTHIGLFTVDGLESEVEVPEVLTILRTDIALVLIEGDVGLWDGRVALTELPGIEVRAHIPPSGFLIQGHPQAIAAASDLSVVATVHPLPLALSPDAAKTRAAIQRLLMSSTKNAAPTWRSTVPTLVSPNGCSHPSGSQPRACQSHQPRSAKACKGTSTVMTRSHQRPIRSLECSWLSCSCRNLLAP